MWDWGTAYNRPAIQMHAGLPPRSNTVAALRMRCWDPIHCGHCMCKHMSTPSSHGCCSCQETSISLARLSRSHAPTRCLGFALPMQAVWCWVKPGGHLQVNPPRVLTQRNWQLCCLVWHSSRSETTEKPRTSHAFSVEEMGLNFSCSL